MFVGKDSLLINVATGEYPLTLADVQLKTTKYAFGEFVDEEILTELGYAVVQPTVRPEGLDMQETAPVLNNGVYVQTFVQKVKTQEELELEFNSKKSDLIAGAENLLEKDLEVGYAYNFGGVYGTQHIQLRDKDRTNLNGILKQVELFPNEVHVLRTYENNTLELSSDAVMTAIVMAGAGYVNLMKAYWVSKDSLKASVFGQNLPSLPETFWT